MAGFSFRFLIVSYEKSARKAMGMARAQTSFYPVKSYWTVLLKSFFNFVFGSPQNHGRSIDNRGEIRIDVAYPLREYEARDSAAACPLEAWIPVPCERQRPARLPGYCTAEAPVRGVRAWVFLAWP